MVLTNAQVTAFFTNAGQMGIPQPTVDQMALEGIATVSDLSEFNKESLQQLADNLRKPGGGSRILLLVRQLGQRSLPHPLFLGSSLKSGW